MTETDASLSAERVDEDLFCMQCGYNLRGLAGDPKRCPECGYLNALADIRMPARAIAAELRRLETAPTICFAGLLALAGGLAIVIGTMGSRDFWRFSFFWMPMLLFALTAWPLGAWRFAASCQYQYGWRRLLGRFHGYAVIIFALGYGALAGTCVSPACLFARAQPRAGTGVAFGLGAIALWALALFYIPRLYRRMKAELEPMQRGVAVEMYRQRASRGRRW